MDVKRLKDKFDQLRTDRKNWDSMYQVLGEYVSLIKQNFEGQPANGEFLIDDIFDSKAPYAAMNAASVLSGMLWSGSAKQSIYFDMADGMEEGTALAEYFQKFTDKVCEAFDDSDAGFIGALEGYMLDQMIFGTSGIGLERGEESFFEFTPYGVKELYIEEGKAGKVSEIHLFFEWTVERVIAEYGIKNVSEKVRKKYENKKYNDKVKILQSFTPRKEKKAEKGIFAMPIESAHIEYDNKHLLRESGFNNLPIKVTRFRKLNYEKYGRSPAMFALPDIKEANILRESVIVATEKHLDPAMGVISDGGLGGNTIDTSAGSVSVFNASAQSGNQPPVFQLNTVGSLNEAMMRLEELTDTIAQHFYIDRLLDFNNDTQMTFGEAQIRAGRSMASLASLFAGQIKMLTDLIERGVDMLLQEGELGVVEGSELHKERKAAGKDSFFMPEAVIKRFESEQDFYKVGYRTQAANAARSEEYIGILDVLGFAMQSMQVDPSVVHRMNLHEGIKSISDLRGLPVGIIREDDEVEEMIEKDNQAAEGQQEMEQMESGAGIVEKLASANQAVRA